MKNRIIIAFTILGVTNAYSMNEACHDLQSQIISLLDYKEKHALGQAHISWSQIRDKDDLAKFIENCAKPKIEELKKSPEKNREGLADLEKRVKQAETLYAEAEAREQQQGYVPRNCSYREYQVNGWLYEDRQNALGPWHIAHKNKLISFILDCNVDPEREELIKTLYAKIRNYGTTTKK
jgi:hypothetical protein